MNTGGVSSWDSRVRYGQQERQIYCKMGISRQVIGQHEIYKLNQTLMQHNLLMHLASIKVG